MPKANITCGICYGPYKNIAKKWFNTLIVFFVRNHFYTEKTLCSIVCAKFHSGHKFNLSILIYEHAR